MGRPDTKTAQRAAEKAAKLDGQARDLKLRAVIARDPALYATKLAIAALERALKAVIDASAGQVPDYYKRAELRTKLSGAAAGLAIHLESQVNVPGDARPPEAPTLPFEGKEQRPSKAGEED